MTADAPTVPQLRRRRLAVEREDRALSQEALALMAGTSQPTVSLAERGFATPHTLEKLARALGFAGEPSRLMDVVVLEAVRFEEEA